MTKKKVAKKTTKSVAKKTAQVGLESLVGQRITLFCCRYIYTGNLVSVDDKAAHLTDCGIVYETGSFSDPNWKDCQKMIHDWSIMLASVESFGLMK